MHCKHICSFTPKLTPTCKFRYIHFREANFEKTLQIRKKPWSFGWRTGLGFRGSQFYFECLTLGCVIQESYRHITVEWNPRNISHQTFPFIDEEWMTKEIVCRAKNKMEISRFLGLFLFHCIGIFIYKISIHLYISVSIIIYLSIIL